MDLFLGLGRCYPVWRKEQNKEAKGSSVLTAWGCRADGSPGWEAHFSGRTEAPLASQGSEVTRKCSPAPAAPQPPTVGVGSCAAREKRRTLGKDRCGINGRG